MSIPVEDRRCRCGEEYVYVIYFWAGIGSFQPGAEPVVCRSCRDGLDGMTEAARGDYFTGYPLEAAPTLGSILGCTGRAETTPDRAKA